MNPVTLVPVFIIYKHFELNASKVLFTDIAFRDKFRKDITEWKIYTLHIKILSV